MSPNSIIRTVVPRLQEANIAVVFLFGRLGIFFFNSNSHKIKPATVCFPKTNPFKAFECFFWGMFYLGNMNMGHQQSYNNPTNANRNKMTKLTSSVSFYRGFACIRCHK